MKRFAILATAFSFLCGCSAPAATANGDECWKHVLNIPGKANNEFTICRTGTQAIHQVYFPDSLLRLMPPTTCTSKGMATYVPDSITFSFEMGTCENGRSFNPSRFECKRQRSALFCKYDDIDLQFDAVNAPSAL